MSSVTCPEGCVCTPIEGQSGPIASLVFNGVTLVPPAPEKTQSRIFSFTSTSTPGSTPIVETLWGVQETENGPIINPGTDTTYTYETSAKSFTIFLRVRDENNLCDFVSRKITAATGE